MQQQTKEVTDYLHSEIIIDNEVIHKGYLGKESQGQLHDEYYLGD